MIKHRVDVGSGRPTRKNNGNMHQLTVKTEEGYQCVQTYRNHDDGKLEPGIYECDFQIRQGSDKDGYSQFVLVPDLLTLKPVK